jgi:hypothetical protein
VKYDAAFIGVPMSTTGAVGKSVQAWVQGRGSVVQVVAPALASLAAPS